MVIYYWSLHNMCAKVVTKTFSLSVNLWNYVTGLQVVLIFPGSDRLPFIFNRNYLDQKLERNARNSVYKKYQTI